MTSASERSEELVAAAESTEGFLSSREGLALCAAARRAAMQSGAPLVEVGAYLGRSTLFLAAGIAAAGTDTLLYSVDHHHGSEEMQSGWPDHDPALVDPATGLMETLPRWRRRIDECDANGVVIGVVGDSASIAAHWSTPLSLVFLDGGHGQDVEWADFRGWAPKLIAGGMLLIHDVFPDPRDGGRPPYDCYQEAISSGCFEEDSSSPTESLRVLIARS